MRTWWCAVDTGCSSFEELLHRRVVAQGWPGLNDLRTLLPLVKADDRDRFEKIIPILGDAAYGNRDKWRADSKRVPGIFWNLLTLKKGDLVVASEGLTVRGICQLDVDAVDSYRFDDGGYNYAHSVGFPVIWREWKGSGFGEPPIVPAQGIKEIQGLTKEADKVLRAWDRQ